MNTLKRWLKATDGATAIEYSLIAGFIALVIVGSVIMIGPAIEVPLNEVASTLKNSNNNPAN